MTLDFVLSTREADDRTAYADLSLVRGSMLRIDDGQEILVAVRDGRVWITQEREQRDVVLEAGDLFTITRGGATLLEALRNSVFTLGSSRATRFAQHLGLLIPGERRSVPIHEAGRDLRGRVAAMGDRLARAWLDLYGPPPRRARQII